MKAEKIRIVGELTKKYQDQLARAQKSLEKKTRPNLRDGYEADLMLFRKWAYRVGKGWYGFSLGPVPSVWGLVLDDFLEWLEKRCPDFEILQIKIKWGKLVVYLDLKSADESVCQLVNSEIIQLERLLRHEHLIR